MLLRRCKTFYGTKIPFLANKRMESINQIQDIEDYQKLTQQNAECNTKTQKLENKLALIVPSQEPELSM